MAKIFLVIRCSPVTLKFFIRTLEDFLQEIGLTPQTKLCIESTGQLFHVLSFYCREDISRQRMVMCLYSVLERFGVVWSEENVGTVDQMDHNWFIEKRLENRIDFLVNIP